MDENSMNDTDITDDFPSIDTSEDFASADLPDEKAIDTEPNEALDAESDVPNIPQDYPLNDVLDIHNISDWIGDINPNFDPFDVDSPYSTNCGSCAYAVYQRLEGFGDACATEDNIDYNYQMNALTGMEQVSLSPAEIEAILLDAGDGSHAIIGIDRSEGPGHWFNAACIDGKVVAIDGQTGEMSDWPPDYGDVVNWEMSMRRN